MASVQAILEYTGGVGVVLAACARAPLIVSVYRGTRRVSRRATAAHALSRLCVLVYASSQEMGAVMVDSTVALLIDASLLAALSRQQRMKKSASDTELHLMAPQGCAS